MKKGEKQTRIRGPSWTRKCRAWVWYAAVKSCAYEVDDELDRIFIPGAADNDDPDKRPRVFSTIRRLGKDPGSSTVRTTKRTLVELVDADPKYQGAKEVYDSALWDLLRPRAKTPKEIDDAIESQAKSRGLYRSSSREARIGSVLYPESPLFAVSRSLTPAYKKFVESLSDTGDIEDIAFLCMLYRQAVFRFSVDIASYLANAIMIGLADFTSSIMLYDDADLLFDALIQRRILGNNWSVIPSNEAVKLVELHYQGQKVRKSLTDRLTQRKQIHSLLVDSYLSDGSSRPYLKMDAKLEKQLERVRARSEREVSMAPPTSKLDDLVLYRFTEPVINSVTHTFSPFNTVNEDKLVEIFGRRKRVKPVTG